MWKKTESIKLQKPDKSNKMNRIVSWSYPKKSQGTSFNKYIKNLSLKLAMETMVKSTKRFFMKFSKHHLLLPLLEGTHLILKRALLIFKLLLLFQMHLLQSVEFIVQLKRGITSQKITVFLALVAIFNIGLVRFYIRRAINYVACGWVD